MNNEESTLAQSIFEEAQKACQVWQYRRSLDLLDSIDAKFANRTELIRLKARNFALLGSWKDSLSHWKQLLELAPDDLMALNALPTCFANLGERERALVEQEKLVQLWPSNVAIQTKWLLLRAPVDTPKNIISYMELLKQKLLSSKDYGALLDQVRLKLISLYDINELIANDRHNVLGLVHDGVSQGFDLRSIYLNFESLGVNCEFGCVQRNHGAEPLGLFRWAGIEYDSLLRLLRMKLIDYDRPENYRLAGNYADEYLLVDTVYGSESHTHVNSADVSPEHFLAQLRRRQVFLKRKFLEDAAAGEKIFVHKSRTKLDDDSIDALDAALRELGVKHSLFVFPAETLGPPGTTELHSASCMIGYLSAMMPDIKFREWDKIVTAAFHHFKFSV